MGQDGSPATLVVPDPRSFALNRLWLSQQEDRDAAQRAKDLSQALAVAALRAGAEVAIDDAECVGKSHPGFFEDLAAVGGRIHE